MKTLIIKSEYVGTQLSVTFKYWRKGECACTGKTITRFFDKTPSEDELVASILNDF